MLSVAGLFMMLGIIVMIVGIIWTIINKIKKKSIKKTLISIVVGAIILVIAVFSTLFISSDYKALATEEGDKFAKLVQSGENVNNKTLTFRVAERGKESPLGVGLAIPTSSDYLNILLESNSDTHNINIGDTVTVRMDSISSVFGITNIHAKFINIEK